MRKVSNSFGIGQSTVLVMVHEVTKTISVVMADDYIKLPLTNNRERCERVSSKVFLGHWFPSVPRGH